MKIKDYAEEIINKIENIQLSFWSTISLIYIAIFFRTFLENFANTSNLNHMTGFVDTFLGYPAWFSIIFLAVFIIARILTKEEITKVSKVVAVFSFIVMVPPIVDLILNKGNPIPYIFISGNYSELLKSFFTYFGGGDLGIGIRTEVAVVLTGFGFYIFNKTKNVGHTIIGIFLLYSTIFVALIFPTLVLSLKNTISNEYQVINKSNTIDFYFKKEPVKSVTEERTFLIDTVIDKNFYSPLAQRILNMYSTTFAIIFLAINAILMGWYLFLYSSKKFFAVFRNFRYLRIVHYFLMISVGIYLGVTLTGRSPVGSIFDLFSFVSLFLAILFAWLFAVWENDEVDIEIDRISNQERPLVKEDSLFSLKEWQDIKYLFLTYSLGFAFLSGLYSLVFVLLFIFVYHIYSTPPLKLKRFIGISSLLIAINALLAVWMGFFLSAGTEKLSAFPGKYTFAILLIFLLVENVKNIKDIEGDKKEGIKTIPVIFGEKKGKMIIGCCLFLAAILVPFIFYFSIYTLLLGIFFGIMLFRLTNRKEFKENYIFITYFIYIVLFFVMINI
ncbi:UbiA family prenyltransferase [Candidatus Nomurabacteria bacterium]|nr:UbiA family prenyltransferase [Candidatus Nomurabacteria bacterium]